MLMSLKPLSAPIDMFGYMFVIKYVKKNKLFLIIYENILEIGEGARAAHTHNSAFDSVCSEFLL